ncbi:hypothetical protein [Crossiella cryophila]|uniref:RNA polymerase sigma-70 region 2 domain-containing protein n=1 Tax=Crossiella cryophila TaxID=43355 RepID=A0A7W7FUA5_9PSEU|nr:hypothetical protein [Crossiella cryophila]MBB4677243.1 hypothetical protein [Crossiella cryophila]
MVSRPSLNHIRQLCAAHTSLDIDALTALAPIAADGHRAHLVLHIAAHCQDWIAGRSTPPEFITLSKHAKGLNWDAARHSADDPAQRAELELRRSIGEVATTHLVRLAEPLVQRVVRQLMHRTASRTAVLDTGDMLNVARLAVTQGIWAYDPARCSGPYYLRRWIEEHAHRNAAPVMYQVSVPTRTHRKFVRLAAVRATLASQLNREPTHGELLAHPDSGFTQADLDDERATRPRRCRTGAGLNPGLPEDLSAEIDPMVPATHDRADSQPNDVETEVIDKLGEQRQLAAVGWRAAVQILQLGEQQTEILARHAGLPPHESLSESQRSEDTIAAHLGLPAAMVHEVLMEIRCQLSFTAGRLHHILGRLSTEDIEQLELVTFQRYLGPLPADSPPPSPLPRLLTMPLPTGLPQPRTEDRSNQPTPVSRYLCGHCGWRGHERARQPRFVLRQLRCPDCDRCADLTTETSGVANPQS